VPLQTIGDDRLFSVKIDTRVLDDIAAKAPRVAYFWMRNFMGQSLGKHRQTWLRKKGIRFGRGKAGSRAIQVPQVNEGPAGVPPDNFVTYRVVPRDVRFATPRAAREGLRKLFGEAQTGSIALRVHEFGETVRSDNLMAIPIRTRPGTPKAWRARYPKRALVTIKTKRGGLILYERQRKRGGARVRKRRTKKGKIAKSQPRTKVDVLRPRFLLLRVVKMKKTLQFYDTWEQLRSSRTAAFARTMTRMVRDIQSGVDT